MPTKRTLWLTTAALLLYFFANQTQVGWLYIMSALLLGTLIAAWLFGLRALRRLTGIRTLDAGDGEVYEGDSLGVELTLNNVGKAGVYQIRTAEACPLAAPDSPQREMKVFLPEITPGDSVKFSYTVDVDRRGLHTFPPLLLRTRAPFGLFRRQRKLDMPTRVLVYPEVRPLRHLSLLDYTRAQQSARPKSGLGSEVIGVRPFRSGDSPRHIHWRSLARTGQLMSKEFADEAQPGLALALDLFAHPYAATDSKHTPFEWAVKVAVSVADYARLRNYPLYIIADDETYPAPGGAVAWHALLQYLARVQPVGKQRFNAVLERAAVYSLVAAVLPYPDDDARAALIALRYRGCSLLAVLMNPQSFPAGGLSAQPLVEALSAAQIDTRLIQFNTETSHDWTTQLSAPEEALKA
ncbi:MAG: DUF58 domain-containing protein [Chloroflexi bacterium]|nr:DUF58 domain-containing protein [Chloroflexota bacterium]